MYPLLYACRAIAGFSAGLCHWLQPALCVTYCCCRPRGHKSKRCASMCARVLQAPPPHVSDGAVSVCAMPLS